MDIGLIDVDNTGFPNLALMKLSALHKAKDDSVEFATMFGNYDILYKSKIFTFTQEQKNFCRWVNHKAIFNTVPWEDYKK